jgi:hypothetical protein
LIITGAFAGFTAAAEIKGVTGPAVGSSGVGAAGTSIAAAVDPVCGVAFCAQHRLGPSANPLINMSTAARDKPTRSWEAARLNIWFSCLYLLAWIVQQILSSSNPNFVLFSISNVHFFGYPFAKQACPLRAPLDRLRSHTDTKSQEDLFNG